MQFSELELPTAVQELLEALQKSMLEKAHHQAQLKQVKAKHTIATKKSIAPQLNTSSANDSDVQMNLFGT
jgi:phage regulator Rha-like protein